MNIPACNAQTPNAESHSIIPEDKHCEKVVIPLFLKGVTSYFNVEPLTCEEFEAHDCQRITMTSKDLTWDPNSDVHENRENNMIEFQGEMVHRNVPARRPLISINSVYLSICIDAANITTGNKFADVLEVNINVSHVKTAPVHL